MFGGQLERVEDAENCGEVAAGAHGVGELELDFFVGAYDEDGAHGGVVIGSAAFGGFAAVGGEHAVELGYFEFGIADHGIVHLVPLGLFDVHGPFGVAADGIHADGQDFCV